MDTDFDDLLNVDGFNLNDFNDTDTFLNGETLDVNLNNFYDINDDFPVEDYEGHGENKNDLVFAENNVQRFKRDEPSTFDYLLSDNSNKLKVEPSISSGCNTDDSSSAHSSPMARIIKKRDYQNFSTNVINGDSSLLPLPTKIIKEESLTPLPRQIIKYPNGQTKTVNGRSPIFINTISSNRPNVVQLHKTISTNSNSQYGISKIQNCNIRTPNNLNGEKNIIIRSMSNISHANNNNNISNINNISQNNNSNNNTNLDNNSFINQPNNYRHGSESPLSDYDRKSEYYSSNKSLRYYDSNTLNLNKNAVNSGGIFQHPIPQNGTLVLTDEEKRTLAAEGFSIPTRLPLTKQDERNLKKVRRKIKNKISAQESRRKKKEYVDSLEKRVEQLEAERLDYKRKLDQYENANRCLNTQLRQMQQQQMSNNRISNPQSSNTTTTISHHTNNTSTNTISSNTNTANHSIKVKPSSPSSLSSSSPSSNSLMIFLLCFVFALCGGGGTNNTSMTGWGYRAQMRLPSHALIADINLLNPAQNMMKYDALQHNLTRNRYALTYYHNIDHTIKPQYDARDTDSGIGVNQDGANKHSHHKSSNLIVSHQQQQRPSILLGDDNGDDLNFEEWIKNYKVGFICNRNSQLKSTQNNSKNHNNDPVSLENQSQFEFIKSNKSKSSNTATKTDSYYDSYYKIYTSYLNAMTA